ELLQAGLALRRADGPAEVLGRHDRRGVQGPEVGELDAPLLEDRLAGAPVLLDDGPLLPGHLVIGVHTLRGVDALDLQTLLAGPAAGAGLAGGLGHAASPRFRSVLVMIWSLMLS